MGVSSATSARTNRLTTLRLLSLDEFVDEAQLLRLRVDAGGVRRLMALGTLPFLGSDLLPRFGLTALLMLADCLESDALGRVDALSERAQLFASAAAGVSSSYALTFNALRGDLAKRAVLGELQRMLPVLEPSALQSLRGDARLEWRMREALDELSVAIAESDLSDHTYTPAMGMDVVEQTSNSQITGELKPRRTDSGSHPLFSELGRKTELHRPVSDVPLASTFNEFKATVERRKRREREQLRSAEPTTQMSDDVETIPFIDPLRRRMDGSAAASASPVRPEPRPDTAPSSPTAHDARSDAESRETALAPTSPPSALQPEEPSGSDAARNTEFDTTSGARRVNVSAAQRAVDQSDGWPFRSDGDAGVDSTVSGIYTAAAAVEPPDNTSDVLIEDFGPARGLSPAFKTAEPSRAPNGPNRGTERHRRVPTDERQPAAARRNTADPLAAPVAIPALGGARGPIKQRLLNKGVGGMWTDRDSSSAAERTTTPTRAFRAEPPSERAEPPSERAEPPSERAEPPTNNLDAVDTPSLERERVPTKTNSVVSTVANDATALLEQAIAALQRSATDRVAQSDLLVIAGHEDRALGERAWKALAPALRTQGRPDELLAALLLMAELETVRAKRLALRREAAILAEDRLGNHQQAFDLYMALIRDGESSDELLERASTLAEAFNWWAPFAENLRDLVMSAERVIDVVPATRAAALIFADRLMDRRGAAALYRRLHEAGRATPSELFAIAEDDRDKGDLKRAHQRFLEVAGSETGAERARAFLSAADVSDDDEEIQVFLEAALLAQPTNKEARGLYVRRAQTEEETAHAIAFLADLEPESDVDRELQLARIANVEFGDSEAEIKALRQAIDHAGARNLETGFALSEAQGEAVGPEEEESTLRAMRDLVTTDAEFVEVTLRLHDAIARRGADESEALQPLQDAFNAGRYDDRVVQKLVDSFRARGRVDEVVDIYAICAEQAFDDPPERQRWLRHVAWVAANELEDDEQAIVLLEEAVDAAQGDPVVLLALARRCRKVDDTLSEMTALERIVDQDAIGEMEQWEVARLAELQIARPRGAQRAAEILELLLTVPILEEDAAERVNALLPRVAEEASRYDLHLAWLQRQVDASASVSESVVLWKLIVDLQEKADVAPAQRIEALEHALDAAEQAGAGERDIARLHSRLGQARRAAGQWEMGLQHAEVAARTWLELDPGGDESHLALIQLEELAREVRDDRMAFVLLER
ncbi:MAG: hypothetical protein ACJA1R_002418, partial [Flavobacteriales bacterium]